MEKLFVSGKYREPAEKEWLQMLSSVDMQNY
jgi:hypothetical protein